MPPRVLILGPDNSGKTSACKILANYAVRAGAGWAPLLINLDPAEGGWTVPGTVSACSLTMPIPTSSPASPLGSTATSAPTALSSSALVPLVFWFGHAEARRNTKLMERRLSTLGDCVTARLASDVQTRNSGIIIDTPGSFASPVSGNSDIKYPLIKACADAFRVNVIVVIGHEKLYVEMQKMFERTEPNVSVIKIPKSGGVVELDFNYRERIHSLQFRSYFYGTKFEPPPAAAEGSAEEESLPQLPLSPHSATIGFSELTIYRIGSSGSMAPNSALPIGGARVISEIQPILVDPTQPGSGLLNSVLGLLSQTVDTVRPDDIIDMDVAGFLVVTALDIATRKMTIISPHQGSLAGRIAVLGSLEWQES